MAKGTKAKKELKPSVKKESKPLVKEESKPVIAEESKPAEPAVSDKGSKGIDLVVIMIGGGILIGILFIILGLLRYVLHIL